MVPLVVLRGDADSGKDTLGAAVAEMMGGLTMGFADALKRMARDIFYFSNAQLWGPSAERNRPDPRLGLPTLYAVDDHGRGGRVQRLCQEWAEGLWIEDMEGVPAVTERWWREALDHAEQKGPLSPRYVLQTLGTEWGRRLSPTVWVDHALAVALELLEGGSTYTREEGIKDAPGRPSPGVVIITDARFPNEVLAAKLRGGAAVDVRRPSGPVTTSTGVAGHSSEGLALPDHYYDRIIENDGSLEDLVTHGAARVSSLFRDASVHSMRKAT